MAYAVQEAFVWSFMSFFALGVICGSLVTQFLHAFDEKCDHQVGEAFTQVMMFDDARTVVEKALEIHVKLNGKSSIDVAIDRRLLSVIYSGLEKHEKALEEQLRVRSILKEKNLGSEALFVEIAIADTQVTLGKIDDAIATLQNVITNLEEGNSLRVLATVNLSKAYTQKGNEEKAGEYSRYLQVSKSEEKHCGESLYM